MSDPYYTQHPGHPSTTGSGATFYGPPDSLYQGPPYDYGVQRVYTPQNPQDQGYVHGPPQRDISQAQNQNQSQIPRTYQPQSAGVVNEYLSAPTTESDDRGYESGRLSPYYQPGSRQGSNSEYYYDRPATPHEGSRPSTPSASHAYHEGTDDDGDDAKNAEGERGLGGTLAGGATGYFLGHKKDHGLLGAVGGAILGNFLQNKVEENREGRHSSHRPSRHRHHHRHHRSRSRHSHHSSSS